MDKIEYKGIKYACRNLTISDGATTFTCTIADDSLFDAISKDDKNLEENSLEENIDGGVYFYVPVGTLDLTAEEICTTHLDQYFVLIADEDKN